MNSLFIEKFAPIFLASIAAISWWYWGFSFSIGYVKELLAGIITAAAIGAGFMATALSILLTISNTSVAEKIKRSQYSVIFYRYIRSCFYSCLVLVAIALIAFTLIDTNHGLNKGYTTFIVSSGTYALASFVRVTEILLDIFEAD